MSNLRSMLLDYSRVGERLWERFSASKEQQSGYNAALISILAELRFDNAASGIYREMVGLYEALFAPNDVAREEGGEVR